MTRAQEIRKKYFVARNPNGLKAKVKLNRFQVNEYAQKIFNCILDQFEKGLESKSSYFSKIYLFPDLSNGNFIVTLNNQEVEEMDIPFDKNILKQVVRMFRKEKGYTVKYISRWQGFVEFGTK